MLNRRSFIAAATAFITAGGSGGAWAQVEMPNARTIQRRLEVQPEVSLEPARRLTVQELRRRPDIRRMAPSIEIQSINFAFGSDEIHRSQYDKIENIAVAMRQILRRNRREVFLIEGHTDAVGSDGANQVLSERRANAVRRVLSREFRVPGRALETAGYGEEFLLVPTEQPEWRNRRVTLRRITDVIRPF